MNIKILTEDNYETKNNFINYLIKQLQKLIIEKYNKEKSFIIEKYINDNEIIKYRYGLEDTRPLTQREVALKLGISRSYISRLETKAMETIKLAVEKNNLLS